MNVVFPARVGGFSSDAANIIYTHIQFLVGFVYCVCGGVLTSAKGRASLLKTLDSSITRRVFCLIGALRGRENPARMMIAQSSERERDAFFILLTGEPALKRGC